MLSLGCNRLSLSQQNKNPTGIFKYASSRLNTKLNLKKEIYQTANPPIFFYYLKTYIGVSVIKTFMPHKG
jgi:hypothetical protein